jgi:hypothetical protein
MNTIDDIPQLVHEILMNELNDALDELVKHANSQSSKKYVDGELRPHATKVIERSIVKLGKLVDVILKPAAPPTTAQPPTTTENKYKSEIKPSLHTSLVEVQKLNLERRQLLQSLERNKIENQHIDITLTRRKRIKEMTENKINIMSEVLSHVQEPDVKLITDLSKRIGDLKTLVNELTTTITPQSGELMFDDNELITAADYNALASRLDGTNKDDE